MRELSTPIASAEAPPSPLDLLIECARPESDPAALRLAAERVTDWDDAIVRAERHRLRPLLHWRLSRLCPGAAPPAVAARLEEAFRANAWRNLRLELELAKVLDWLDAEGIPAIAFKGLTLAVLAYENHGLREFCDLDLLVRREHRDRAVSALETRGCRAIGARGAERLSGNSEITMMTPDAAAIDLHWTVSPPYFLPFDDGRAWGRTRQVPLAGRLVRTLGPDDLFLALALHGAREAWPLVSHVCDVAHLVRASPPTWDRVLEHGRNRRVLLLASLLAADLLSAPVPAPVVAAARAEPATGRLADELRQRIVSGRAVGPGSRREARLHLCMMTTWRDRARYLCRRALLPTQMDNDFLPLPAGLRPILRVARPLRVLGKLTRRS